MTDELVAQVRKQLAFCIAGLTLAIICSLSGMGISLWHIARALESFVAQAWVVCFALAVIIDGLLIAGKIGKICFELDLDQTSDETKKAARCASFVFWVCSLLSVALNTWSFVDTATAQGKGTFSLVFAAFLGLFLVIMVISGTSLSSYFLKKFMGCRKLISEYELQKAAEEAKEKAKEQAKVEKAAEKREAKAAAKAAPAQNNAQPAAQTQAPVTPSMSSKPAQPAQAPSARRNNPERDRQRAVQ